jgi:predicted dehydrogenase
MQSLVVGLGIGSLYVDELTAQGIKAYTVDSNTNKSADFKDIKSAISAHKKFDTVHICTPNFCHYEQAASLAPYANIIFVEKPGVASSAQWQSLIDSNPNTRFIMVKNNQYRDEFKHFVYQSDISDQIKIVWSNKNRIPNPGSWFTTKSLAFGGVSRDLLPHLLSYVTGFFDNYTHAEIINYNTTQCWDLKSTTSSDYGNVNTAGTYDVDDLVTIELLLNNKKILLEANWRNDLVDENYISFGNTFSAIKYNLGLCPNYAYGTMIKMCLDNLSRDDFWQNQYKQDIWIHQIMEQVCK